MRLNAAEAVGKARIGSRAEPLVPPGLNRSDGLKQFFPCTKDPLQRSVSVSGKETERRG